MFQIHCISEPILQGSAILNVLHRISLSLKSSQYSQDFEKSIWMHNEGSYSRREHIVSV